ncbi:CRISPR-associated endoribonuclease Cas6 [Catalinimonas alkaloidigena]|uniref:CRISPR-associated endoribonuclease Cas6 n=1 Tax=Catalinimonas alkaloidigena TaxID=1075417 RepID=A0A1G9TVL3_9BACT|nr:CRISPR-associated endoribonuclease Cas6 [Catalinimonas alkaloidigena]SDM51800.1 CRISPR-associated endoribonuclease Cas6 [Catalinimonas alkaloidigena]
MRLQLHLTPNTEPVPFNHLHHLTGALHKWLGPNDLHDGLSLYSFGWLHNAKRRKDQLHFPHGSVWNLSFFDPQIAKTALNGVMQSPTVAYGMNVNEVQLIDIPELSNSVRFYTDRSSIVIRRRREDGSRQYLLWDQPEVDEALTQLLRRKLEVAGLTGDHLKVRVAFDREYPDARTRTITIKKIQHRGSECPVIVEGTSEALQFAWTVGIGELTGSGFGAVC